MTATTSTTAVGYVRISQDRDEQTSTTTQEERIRAYCAGHGWDVVEVVVEAGRSAYRASRSSRPGFRRAKEMVEAGAANALVVWKIDRAARNAEDTLALARELRDNGARFVSVTESFDTGTPSGKMMLTMLAGLAEMESATKSERTKVWQEHRLAVGAVPTGPRPFGYRREHNALVVDRTEAALVRQAADELLAGASLRSVVRGFEAAGVHGKNGRPLTSRTVAGILTNPTVAACREASPGTFVRSDRWEPLLDRERWDAVRALLTDPERRSTPGNGRRHLLSGIVRCGPCIEAGHDGAMRSMPHKKGTRYSCLRCHLSVEAAHTEELVSAALLDLLDAKTWRRLRRGRPVEADAGDGFEEEMAALSERFVAGDVDAVQLADLAEALRRRHQQAAAPPPALPDVDNIRAAWPTLPLEQRRLVLHAATESLTVGPWKPTNRFDPSRVTWTPSL
jgi:DNA invertase Pin-like site-specific DNA recombinase